MYLPTVYKNNKNNLLYQLGVPANIPSWFNPNKSYDKLLEEYDKEQKGCNEKSKSDDEIVTLSNHYSPKSLAGMYAIKRYSGKDLEFLLDDIDILNSRHNEFVLKSYNIMCPTLEHIGKMRLEFFSLLNATLEFRYKNMVKSLLFSGQKVDNSLLDNLRDKDEDDLKAQRNFYETRYDSALWDFNKEDDSDVFFKPKGFGYEEIDVKSIFPRKVELRCDYSS